MRRCAVYLRQSLDATGERLAITRQREDCLKLAAERGWEVTQEYCDNSLSGSKKTVRRPAYERMVTDFEAGQFEAIVCADLDRLTRQPVQLEYWIEAAEERGLLLVTTNGEADLGTDGGRLFARIKASVARAEVERKSARQKRAAVQRAESGKVPAGVRLTGYTMKGEVIPAEAKLVRTIFARFVAGDSLKGITAWLQEEGVQTRGGRPWNPSTTRSILVNPRYAGRAVYCGQTTGRAGQWEALVDEATFDLVQARLNDPRRITNRQGTDRKYLGSGLFLCGVCDSPVTSFSGKRYRCPQAHVIRMSLSIDRLVEKLLQARLSRPDAADLLADPDDEEAQRLTQVIERLHRRLQTIEADYDAELIDGRRYQVASAKVQAELKAAELARAQLVGGQGLAAILSAPDPALAFAESPLGIKRTVLAALLEVRLLPWQRGVKFRPESLKVKWLRQPEAAPAEVA